MTESLPSKVGERKRPSFLVDFLTRLVKEKPLGTVGGVITAAFFLAAIFCDFLAPYKVNQIFAQNVLEGPSAQFWLGTDYVGRDLLSRVIFGARVSVIVGLAATSLSTVTSVIIGVVSGYIGGKVDLIMQRFVDAVMCVPGLILLMAIISVVGVGMGTLIIVLGIVWGISSSRVVRGAVIGIKENAYVEAAQAIGCSTTRILTRHILPNIMAPVIINFTLSMPGIILTEASLSFLGYGIPPPHPSWGSMLGQIGRDFMFLSPYMVIWPGLALATVVYGINMFGDAMRDLLDPKLRGGVGRYGVRVKKQKGGDANQSSTTE